MSNLVIPMPPLSMRMIHAAAEAFLKTVAPAMLLAPVPLNVAALVDDVLPQLGINFYPGGIAEMVGSEGLTIPDGEGPIDVLIEEEQWELLHEGGRRANRARGTVLHEVGHAVLHVPIIRRRRSLPNGERMLHRVPARGLKCYCDPEWQAFAFAGCALMPRATLAMLTDRSPAYVARLYGVSETFAANHLRRLGM